MTGTTDEPRYAATGWAMIEGNPNFTIDIESENGWAFDGGQLTEDVPFTTLTVTGTLYNRDVTAHILDDDISWTRDTGNVAEDNAWAIKRPMQARAFRSWLTTWGWSSGKRASVRSSARPRCVTDRKYW